MEIRQVRINMLGKFSIELGDTELSEQGTRSRKVWSLLAYMICCRDRAVPQTELIHLLWGDEGSANPQNALKTMFHRVRTLLGEAGHDLIVRQGGTYAWNKEIPIEVDAEQFDQLCCAAARESTEEQRIRGYLRAVELYKGDFLPMFSTELWAVPLAAYYHNLYLHVVQELLPLLEARGRKAEAVELCRRTLKVEPYQEVLYRHLIRDLLDQGDQKGAVQAYEEMRQMLQDNFGVKPSEELRALYREAVRTVNDQTVSPDTLLEQLREPSHESGAMMCEYDFFRVIYHAVARVVARSGDAAHIVLLTVQGSREKELPKRSLERVMENLQEIIQVSLRRCDVMTCCSPSQYILLLPQANFENSYMVSERVKKAFARQYPHSPAELSCVVQPIEPSER